VISVYRKIVCENAVCDDGLKMSQEKVRAYQKGKSSLNPTKKTRTFFNNVRYQMEREQKTRFTFFRLFLKEEERNFKTYPLY
jgi:hypothetical protein